MIGMPSAFALGIFSGKMIFICETGRSADLPVSLFSRMEANHKPGRQKHLPGLLFAIFFTAPRR